MDHNHRGRCNIFRFKSGKCKTTKGIFRPHGFTETSWWDLRRCAGEKLCSLQKMDQRVNTTTKNFITLYRVIKLHDTDKESIFLLLFFGSIPTPHGFSQSSRLYCSMVKISLLPWRVLPVLERVSICNPNFVVKNSSHVTSEFYL